MPSIQPEPLLIAALIEVAPDPFPNAQTEALWDQLQVAIETYKVSTATSLSSEGLNRTIDVDSATQQVINWHAAYRAAIDAAALEDDETPLPTARPMGHTVRNNLLPLCT